MKTRIWQFIVILSLASTPILVYLLSSTKSQKNIRGTVIDFGATTDEVGNHPFLVIKLDNNRTVTVKYDLASGNDIGRRVLVAEITKKLFDIKVYRIIKWN